MSGFQIGDEVICLSDDFPIAKAISETENEDIGKPKTREVLFVLGWRDDYIMFEKYNTPMNNNWFHSNRFMLHKNFYKSHVE